MTYSEASPMIDSQGIGDWVRDLASGILGAFVGWLWANSRKPTKHEVASSFAEFEKRVVEPMVHRMERMEARSTEYITRTEVRDGFAKLEVVIEKYGARTDVAIAELRADIRREH